MVRASLITGISALIISVTTAVLVFARDDTARNAGNPSGATTTTSETLAAAAVEAQTPWPSAVPTPLLWARAATAIAASATAGVPLPAESVATTKPSEPAQAGEVESAQPPPLPSPTAAPAPPANPRILFGLGPQPDSAASSKLNADAPLGMYSSWYNGPKDLDWMHYWYTSGFIRHTIYGAGRAAHLIIWSDVPNATSPVCGRPYPVSTQILSDMQTLATYWAGSAADPPLYVTLFTEFQTYPCQESQWSGAEDYYAILKQRMLQIRDIFHQYAPNSRVSIGWGGWQARWDDPAGGGGRSLIPHFADVMQQMDFQSVQLMHDDGNIDDARDMVATLGAFGPVMVAHYKPEKSDDTRFHDDVAAIMTDGFLGDLVAHGLFAWSFMDQSTFNDASDPAEAANYQLVADAVQRYSRH